MAKKLKETYRQTYRLPLVVLSAAVAAKRDVILNFYHWEPLYINKEG